MTVAGGESPEEGIRRDAIRLLAIAQSGLAYCHDVFDRQRYEQVQQIGVSLLSRVADGGTDELSRLVCAETGYATPKVDVRGAVFDKQNRILLIRERSDGRWAMPGGWCDVLESPSEAVIREIREESGVVAEVVKVAAVLDRERQGNRPPLPFHVYKLFFVCREISSHAPSADETLDVRWFPVDAMPELSTTRVTAEQVRLAYAHHLDTGLPTTFD